MYYGTGRPGGNGRVLSEFRDIARLSGGGKMSVMFEHGSLLVVIIAGFAVQILGLVAIAAMLRESQRLTRAVAGLVYQENDKIRALLGR